ncbi:hypothetical protein C5O19_18725, partial [Siphonobacter curvatus]
MQTSLFSFFKAYCPTNAVNAKRLVAVGKLAAVVIASSIFTGCVSSKNLALFQEGPNTTIDSLNIAQQYTPRVQVGDVLSITVSSLNPEASAVFNLPESQAMIQG